MRTDHMIVPCSDCGAEFDHGPDCMTAAAILQANEPASDAEYGRAIRPLVTALIHAQGDTMADMKALGKLFEAHNKYGGNDGR